MQKIKKRRVCKAQKTSENVNQTMDATKLDSKYCPQPLDYNRQVLKESNAEFNCSPQRKKLEKMAMKNLQQLSFQQSIDTAQHSQIRQFDQRKSLNDFSLAGQFERFKLVNQFGITGWEEDSEAYTIQKLSDAKEPQNPNFNHFEKSCKFVTPSRKIDANKSAVIQQRSISMKQQRTQQPIKNLTNDRNYFNENRQNSVNSTYSKLTYEPVNMEKFLVQIPKKKSSQIKLELEQLKTAEKPKGWVEQCRNNDKILKVIGGMQSLIVVKGVPSNQKIIIESRKYSLQQSLKKLNEPRRNPSVVYIDSPLNCVAQSVTSRLQRNRIKQIQSLQHCKTKN